MGPKRANGSVPRFSVSQPSTSEKKPQSRAEASSWWRNSITSPSESTKSTSQKVSTASKTSSDKSYGRETKQPPRQVSVINIEGWEKDSKKSPPKEIQAEPRVRPPAQAHVQAPAALVNLEPMESAQSLEQVNPTPIDDTQGSDSVQENVPQTEDENLPQEAKTENDEPRQDKPAMPAIVIIHDNYSSTYAQDVVAELKKLKDLGSGDIYTIPANDVSQGNVPEAHFLALKLLPYPSRKNQAELLDQLSVLGGMCKNNLVMITLSHSKKDSNYEIPNSGYMRGKKFVKKEIKEVNPSSKVGEPLITPATLPQLAQKIAAVYQDFIQK